MWPTGAWVVVSEGVRNPEAVARGQRWSPKTTLESASSLLEIANNFWKRHAGVPQLEHFVIVQLASPCCTSLRHVVLVLPRRFGVLVCEKTPPGKYRPKAAKTGERK